MDIRGINGACSSNSSNSISSSEGLPANEQQGPPADFVGGFRMRSFITSLDIAALFGSAEGQLIGAAFIVSLAFALFVESREQRLA